MGTGAEAAIDASDFTPVREDLRAATGAIRLSPGTLGTERSSEPRYVNAMAAAMAAGVAEYA